MFALLEIGKVVHADANIDANIDTDSDTDSDTGEIAEVYGILQKRQGSPIEMSGLKEVQLSKDGQRLHRKLLAGLEEVAEDLVILSQQKGPANKLAETWSSRRMKGRAFLARKGKVKVNGQYQVAYFPLKEQGLALFQLLANAQELGA